MIGDVKQFAWWLTGYESREDLEEFAAAVQAALDQCEEEEGIELGLPKTVTLYPGDPHAPEVPDHISGPDVRLLVTEATVIAERLQIPDSLFLDELEPKDLERLREITRVRYEQEYPGHPRLTDRQCDTLINDLGPEAALATLRSVQ